MVLDTPCKCFDVFAKRAETFLCCRSGRVGGPGDREDHFQAMVIIERVGVTEDRMLRMSNSIVDFHTQQVVDESLELVGTLPPLWYRRNHPHVDGSRYPMG